MILRCHEDHPFAPGPAQFVRDEAHFISRAAGARRQQSNGVPGHAEVVEDEHAVVGFGRPLDPHPRERDIIFAGRALREPDLGRQSRPVDAGGFHGAKRHLSAQHDDGARVLERILDHEP